MAFNFNFFKGATTQQIQYSIQYWMNALRPAEEVDKLKEEKERHIVANVVVEGVEDSKEDESTNAPTPALLCVPQVDSDLHE